MIMEFVGKPKPKPLLPFMKTKDCTLRLCTPICPQWCDGIFPPPGPPPPIAFPEDKSPTTPTFSPLVIAIIGILASAFLLVSYYAIISKYCGRNSSSQRGVSREVQPPNHEEFSEEGYDGASNNIDQLHEAWLISTPGLDEALIKAITLVKFKRGDGLIGSSDCSVCLGDFQEDDTLRLLPKCSHAFHVACIDTWLRSHSNCPLCRANIISPSSSHQPPPNNNNNNTPDIINNSSLVVVESFDNNNNVHDHDNEERERVGSSGEGRQIIDVIVDQGNGVVTKAPFRAMSDLGARGHGGRSSIRRSISMDHRYDTHTHTHVSIPDGEKDYSRVNICEFREQSFKRAAGESSKFGVGNNSSSSSRNGVLHCVMSSVAMKRSFSSGRFLFSKCGRGKNAVFPL